MESPGSRPHRHWAHYQLWYSSVEQAVRIFSYCMSNLRLPKICRQPDIIATRQKSVDDMKNYGRKQGCSWIACTLAPKVARHSFAVACNNWPRVSGIPASVGAATMRLVETDDFINQMQRRGHDWKSGKLNYDSLGNCYIIMIVKCARLANWKSNMAAVVFKMDIWLHNGLISLTASHCHWRQCPVFPSVQIELSAWWLWTWTLCLTNNQFPRLWSVVNRYQVVSSHVRGQYTYSLALPRRPLIPVCPRCMFFFISDLMVPRIMSLCPHGATDNKSLTAVDDTICYSKIFSEVIVRSWRWNIGLISWPTLLIDSIEMSFIASSLVARKLNPFILSNSVWVYMFFVGVKTPPSVLPLYSCHALYIGMYVSKNVITI